jgi:hypothetical protein
MRQNSITYDEFAHLPAGYSYLKTWDFRMYNYNPPLIKMITALPLLFTETQLPRSPYWDSPTEVPVRPWFYGSDFMRANRAIYLDLLFYARLMTLLLSLFLGLLVFSWSKEFYGTFAGYFSLFLYTFCPNILAQSGLATVDLGTSLTLFLAVYCFYRYVSAPTLLPLFSSGIALGLALLSKFTALLLLIVYPLILFVQSLSEQLATNRSRTPDPGLRTRFLHLSLIGLIAFVVLNAGYTFQGSFSPLKDYTFTSHFLKPLNYPFLKEFRVPLPFYYLTGFDNQKLKEEAGSETMLLGEVSRTGWWYYYFFVLLFKLPVPTLVFLVLVLLKSFQKSWTSDKTFLLLPIIVILLAFSFVRLQLGIRYILPILPFLFVYLGQIVYLLSGAKKVVADPGLQTSDSRLWAKFLVIGLSCWYLFSSVSIFPNYLSYFNELAGGPKNGYRILSDANLDVGQGLVQLKKYLTDQGIENVNLLYFGWIDPGLYGIQAHQFPHLSKDGVYAISVAYLQGTPFIRMDTQGRVYQLPPEFFEIFRNVEPVARIAHSIFIYVIPNATPESP